MSALVSLLLSLVVALLPACTEEDSRGCYWDAESRGNGQGVSFIAL